MLEALYSSPHLEQKLPKIIKSDGTEISCHPRYLNPARPLASELLRDGRAREDVIGFELSPFSVLRYGIGGLGTGGKPQMNEGHGGSGGVGIRLPFPFLYREQLGSVAGLHVMQLPVNVSLLG